MLVLVLVVAVVVVFICIAVIGSFRGVGASESIVVGVGVVVAAVLYTMEKVRVVYRLEGWHFQRFPALVAGTTVAVRTAIFVVATINHVRRGQG